MNIELQATFEENLRKGINLFLGAGFSHYAKDSTGIPLPLGSALSKELSDKFEAPAIPDLTKVCTIIDSVHSVDLREYLKNRFTVDSFDSAYHELIKINSPRIFTTNIDDLPFKIFESTTEKYLNNIFIHGNCYNDSNCIDFIPIHGSVDMPDAKFLFNKQEVSGSYRTQMNAWMSLTQAANQIPSLFLGYSLEDVGSIESLYGPFSQPEHQKDKWILLHKADEASEAYFRALGFKLIIGDVKDFLLYIKTVAGLSLKKEEGSLEGDYIESIYPKARVPRNLKAAAIRQIDDFFLGSAPIWSDVLSNRIASTSHLDKIADLAVQDKHLVVTGIPASGKSTLMLQLANKLKDTQRVLLFSDLTINKAEIIRNEINKKTLILVDNCSTDILAFVRLASNPEIRIIGFERYYNIDIVFHLLPKEKFEIYDVSELTPQDVQKVYNSIPLGIRAKSMVTRRTSEDQVSIFEVVSNNVTRPSIDERYKEALAEMYESDPILLDLLVMVCYVHSCRIPVSFEMANAFLSEESYSYDEVMAIMDSLFGLVNESFGSILNELDYDQDYYQPRSQVLSETILSQVKMTHFRKVYEQFHDLVPQHLIPNFHVFKRSAYDAFYTAKAFHSWEDGLKFYETAYLTDKNPFLLQQCSLFLLRKKRFSEAAIKIDKALQTSYKRFISIENTHAIVLFKANIDSETNLAETRKTLDRSMEILTKCYFDDKRKTYHALTFAEQALSYFERYGDAKAIEYLTQSKKWLNELKSLYRARTLLSQIERRL